MTGRHAATKDRPGRTFDGVGKHATVLELDYGWTFPDGREQRCGRVKVLARRSGGTVDVAPQAVLTVETPPWPVTARLTWWKGREVIWMAVDEVPGGCSYTLMPH